MIIIGRILFELVFIIVFLVVVQWLNNKILDYVNSKESFRKRMDSWPKYSRWALVIGICFLSVVVVTLACILLIYIFSIRRCL